MLLLKIIFVIKMGINEKKTHKNINDGLAVYVLVYRRHESFMLYNTAVR